MIGTKTDGTSFTAGYYSWVIVFDADNTEGTTPQDIIRERGYEAQGLFFLESHKILGFIEQEADLSGLEQYEITHIDAQTALSLAQTFDEGVTLNENEELVFTPFVKV